MRHVAGQKISVAELGRLKKYKLHLDELAGAKKEMLGVESYRLLGSTLALDVDKRLVE